VSPQSSERRWLRELSCLEVGIGAESSVVLGAEATNFFFDGWDL
jgi:hypothetical protein